MAKLEFNPEQIQNTIIPNLKDSISSLSPTLNLMDSTVIPGNFKYKTQLLQIKSDLSNAKNSLIDEQDHLTNSINIITKTSDELEKYASVLPVTEITKRVSKI